MNFVHCEDILQEVPS